ncbi:sterol desaturase family protein [Yoonia sediminilitoris]|uniref:Fatty acid hydroxylase family protein n=1 Tax=Yoonia sediminilitoris TaxID=1286148 RepID=A0A2T6KKB4_9RHOB|nr:sterol desaturase family protein [Yoonia sediminilitoris]PUB16404.1 fatty acid hydroxylase family protein [Yoonia sediminilitoris]RCW96753.1 fatty acid hydroxylase family protein [Yoonia sediminilitoris]
MNQFLAFFESIFAVLAEQFWSLVQMPFDPSGRLYVIYIAGGLAFAFWVYLRRKTKTADDSFLAFLLPRSVWSHPSAWLDFKFFLVNQFTGKLLYVGLTGATMAFAFGVTTGGDSLVDAIRTSEVPGLADILISLLYMVVIIAITDFTAFYLHYLQHKIPLLWEFHKVHHSPEVMHPISNFREHPFDNVAYALGIGAVYGVVMGGVSATLGYLPNMPVVLGVPLLVFLFNLGGYHLRHSHIWLRWPGKWSMIFPSPAHHHVHHSCHPDHLDKNFAFMFPLWDVLFKTYHMPEDARDVKFGIYGMEESEYNSVWKLYSIPFRNIARKWRSGQSLTVSPDKPQDGAQIAPLTDDR